VPTLDLLKLAEHINGAKASISAPPNNPAPPIAAKGYLKKKKKIQPPAPANKAEDIPTESGEGKIL